MCSNPNLSGLSGRVWRNLLNTIDKLVFIHKKHISNDKKISCKKVDLTIIHVIFCWSKNKHCWQDRICMHVVLLQILLYFWKIMGYVFIFPLLNRRTKQCFNSRIRICVEIYTSLQNKCLLSVDISTPQLHVNFGFIFFECGQIYSVCSLNTAIFALKLNYRFWPYKFL